MASGRWKLLGWGPWESPRCPRPRVVAMHIGLRVGSREEAVPETASGPLVVADPSHTGRRYRLADLYSAVSLTMLSASLYEATYVNCEKEM